MFIQFISIYSGLIHIDSVEMLFVCIFYENKDSKTCVGKQRPQTGDVVG